MPPVAAQRQSPGLVQVSVVSNLAIRNSNDPYAGSPTKTLLRLLLPLNDQA
jgi:hypothetical protein